MPPRRLGGAFVAAGWLASQHGPQRLLAVLVLLLVAATDALPALRPVMWTVFVSLLVRRLRAEA